MRGIYEFTDTALPVISGYRESTLTDWPALLTSELNDQLRSILARAHLLILPVSEHPGLTPSLQSHPRLLTHLLHLSSSGYILPHVDNVEASAGSILGLCLGVERDLVLSQQKPGSSTVDEIRLRLPAGCAYIQRYNENHSDLNGFPCV